MPHLYDLDTSQKEELISPGLSRIKPKVSLRAKMLGASSQNPDGSYVFGTEYQESEIDVTCGILNEAIVIKSEIPVLPTKSGRSNQQGNVRIQLDNTERYISTIGDESTLDYFNIQDAEFTIQAEAGAMTPLDIFKGKVVRQPT